MCLLFFVLRSLRRRLLTIRWLSCNANVLYLRPLAFGLQFAILDLLPSVCDIRQTFDFDHSALGFRRTSEHARTLMEGSLEEQKIIMVVRGVRMARSQHAGPLHVQTSQLSLSAVICRYDQQHLQILILSNHCYLL